MRREIYIFVAALAVSALAWAEGPRDAATLFEAATLEFDGRRYESALRLYLMADSAYQAEGLDSSAEYAQALHSTGRAFYNTNDIINGREYTRRALVLRERLFGRVSEKYIVSLNNYAISFLMANELEDALRYQKEVIDLCSRLNPPHPDEGMYLINLARIYHGMGDDDAAAGYMEEALPKVEKFSTNYEYALNFLGMVYMENDDNANARRILGLMEEHNQHELTKECNTPECHLRRAEYYMSSGRPANAKDEFLAAFAMPLSDEQKADAYHQYARFLSSQRDFAQAGEYYAMAADASLSAAGETEGATSLRRQAGLCYFIGKKYDKAIAAHTEVIANVDKHGYSEGLKSTSLQGLGNAYSAKKDYPKAITAFKQWIEHLRANGHENEADYAKAYERLASAEKFNSEYDASIADYETAIAIYEQLGMNDEAEQAKTGLAMCLQYAKQDRTPVRNDAAREQRADKLRGIIQSGSNALEQGGDYLGSLFKAQSYATIAGSYAQLGEYDKAIDYYSLYINAIRPALAEDFLLKNPTERELTWRQELSTITAMNALITELPHDTPELYSRLSNLIYDGQLLAKGILLSSNIEFDKVLTRYGTPEMRRQYQQIKSNLAEIDMMKQERLPMEDIQAKVRETDALQLTLARESAAKGVFTDFLKYTSADVADALAADEAAIEFVTLDTGVLPGLDLIVAVVISNEFPTGITIPIATVNEINAIIGDNSRFANDNYTAMVWGGIMEAVQGKKKIFFAPDGVLNNIGIEYLSLNDKPINETIETVRLSSTREICRRQPSRPLLFASLFGDIDYLGDPAPASDKRKYQKTRGSAGLTFSDLDNTGREVSEIYNILKKNVKKSKPFSYTGEKASKAEFLSQDKMPVNLLHIATHGMYIDSGNASSSDDNDAMSRSILAFAGANLYDNLTENQGIVTAAEIAEMELHDCHLVVLSACESGIGKLGSDGVFGLQRGFKNAGVRSLLVSLNEVADEATADMMINFYRNLVIPGATTASALRAAQAKARAAHPDDPTWASFILIDSLD